MSDAEQYQKKTFLVHAREVTEENMEELAQWAGGKVKTNDKGDKFIKVTRVANPTYRKQTEAYVGDWILYGQRQWKVYTDKAFRENFEPVYKEEGNREAEVAAKNIFQEAEQKAPLPLVSDTRGEPDINYRDSATGEYVTKEYAEANPDTTQKETDYEEAQEAAAREADFQSHNPFEVKTENLGGLTDEENGDD
jgi:hypothetical protein